MDHFNDSATPGKSVTFAMHLLETFAPAVSLWKTITGFIQIIIIN